MRLLRAAAWAVFSLDLVILAQLLYGLMSPGGDAADQALLRNLAMLLGSGLLGVVVVLVVSSRLGSRAGLWVALVCGALPLVWVIKAIVQSMS